MIENKGLLVELRTFHTFKPPCVFTINVLISFYYVTVYTDLQRYFPSVKSGFCVCFGVISSYWSLVSPALGATWLISIQQSCRAPKQRCLVRYGIRNTYILTKQAHITSMHDSRTKKPALWAQVQTFKGFGEFKWNKCLTGNQANYFWTMPATGWPALVISGYISV